MKRILFLLACMAAMVCKAQSPEDLFRQAQQKIRENHEYIALSLIDKAIKLSPDSSKYYVVRGNIYLQMLKADDAMENYKTAIQKAPHNAEAYFYRAILNFMLRRPQDALNDNNMAMKYAATDSLRYFALASRASDKVMLRDFNGAIADYEEFIKKDPAHQYEVYSDIASALFQAGRTDDAIAYNMKAYSHDSTNTKPIVNLAYQYGKKGDYDRSLFYSDKALKLEPKNPYALNNKGYAELMQGKLNDALRDINASIAFDPSNAYAYKNRALVYLKQKLKNPACADLKTAKQLGYSQVYDNEVDNLIAKNCAAKAPQKGKVPVHKKK